MKPAKDSVVIRALALRMKESCKYIDFIGRDGKPYERDYEADAIWYVAYHIAEQMHDCNTTKDWAHFVKDGMEPLTVQDVADFFYPEDDEPNFLPTPAECVKWLHG